MKQLPKTKDAPVLRTDFSDQDAWDAIRQEIQQPADGFYANVEFIDDAGYSGAGKQELLELLPGGMGHSFIVVADSEAMTNAEHPLLVVDLLAQPGRQFRAEPSQIQSIENNLSIANMDFAEFAENCDPEGVFRGFPTF